MQNRLIIGDASQVLDRLINENVQVDCVFTSPNPLFYSKTKNGLGLDVENYIGAEQKVSEYILHLCAVFSLVRKILKETGSLWVHMMDTYMVNGSMIQVPERFAIEMVARVGYLLRGKKVWLRGEHEITPGSTAAMSLCPWDWEHVYWFTKTQDYTFNRQSRYSKTSVIDAPYLDNEMTEEVIISALDLTTREGDVVLDCFMGAGPTGKVAKDMGRRFIGIDIVAEKVNAARERLG